MGLQRMAMSIWRDGSRVLRETFRPEFLNRVDDIIVFSKLEKSELREIIKLMIKEVRQEVREQRMDLEVSEQVIDWILEKGYDERYGARPLRRAIQDYIEDEIAEAFLQKRVQPGDRIKVVLRDGKVHLE